MRQVSLAEARPEAIRVLLVEDDEDDFIITRELLARQERARFTVEWRPTYADALEAIRERRHDVYLIDYRLGDRTGLDLVRDGFAANSHAAVIMLTGLAAYETDLEAAALGVTDYLIKQELEPALLERSIRYAIRHQNAIRELSLSEERYALVVRAANDGIWDWDLRSGQIYLSPRWHAILGRAGAPEPTVDADPSTWFDLVHSDDMPRLQ